MKLTRMTLTALIAITGLSACDSFNSMKEVQPEQFKPQTYARFVPEREDDFAWENDKIAFRVYGPNSSAKGPASGVDAWFKSVDYPIINKWYEEHLKRDMSYHVDHGEGHDVYHTGTSRGVGGTAVWIDGKPYAAGTFNSHKVISNSGNQVVFTLNYAWETPLGQVKEVKTVSLKMGSQLYKVTSAYLLNGKPAADLPIAIGLTTHDEAAVVDSSANKGWIATWRDIEGKGVGTGAMVAPGIMKNVVHVKSTDKDKSHIWLVTHTDKTGVLEFFSGFGWEGAGEITTYAQWKKYLDKFAKL